MENTRLVKKAIDGAIKILIVILLVARYFFELLKIFTDVFRFKFIFA